MGSRKLNFGRGGKRVHTRQRRQPGMTQNRDRCSNGQKVGRTNHYRNRYGTKSAPPSGMAERHRHGHGVFDRRRQGMRPPSSSLKGDGLTGRPSPGQVRNARQQEPRHGGRRSIWHRFISALARPAPRTPSANGLNSANASPTPQCRKDYDTAPAWV